MKISILVTQLEAGGAQRAAAKLASGLSARGHQVNLLFLFQKTAFDVRAGSATTQVLGTGNSKYVSIVTGVLGLARHLRAHQPDVLISFTHYANILAGLMRTLGLAGRIIISNRNPYFSYPPVAKRCDRLLAAIGAYDVVTHVSHSVKDSFTHLRGQTSKLREFVIHNSVELEDHVNRASARSRSPYFLSVGRLVPQKNHRLLLEALAASGSNYRLLIVGRGPLDTELRQQALALGLDSQVELLGELPHQEVISLLAGAKAFLMPSLYEGMSNALIEAIAAGVWPVVSDIPSQVEAISLPCGRFGDALPLEIDAWADTLRRLSAGRKDGEQAMAIAPKEMLDEARKYYRLDRFLDEFENAIAGALGR